ncbi:MAG: hypothetical protein MJZ00_06250 [Paludibacteraceae bacterium]|nr:hypothetical protein [Paludibacteraceae bacterium]MCQ2191015.1 hypothetical protein [Paludibacteraceae bacterium]
MGKIISLIAGALLSLQMYGQPVTVVDGSAFGQRIASMSADAENALNNLEQLLDQADKMNSQVSRMDSIKNKVTKVSNRIKMLSRFTDLIQTSQNAVSSLRYSTEVISSSPYLTLKEKTALLLYTTKLVDNIIEDVTQIKELIEHPEKSEMSEHERYNEITKYDAQINNSIETQNRVVRKVKEIEYEKESSMMRKSSFSTYEIYAKSNKQTTQKQTKQINW